MASDSELSSSHCKFHMKDHSGELLEHIDHQELPNPLVGPSSGDIDCPVPNAEENRDYGCDLLQFTLSCTFTIHSTLLDLDGTHVSTLCSRARTEFAANEQGHLRAMPRIHHFI